ncbi:MAG: 3-deoxy-D-manno-octulosonic acid transferase [Dissulfuribacterales bacterium]
MLKIYRKLTSIIQIPLAWLYSRQLILDKTLSAEERRQRFGIYSLKMLKNAPYDLWIHAASVGEVMAGAAILRSIKRIMPNTNVLLSVFTATGYQRATKELNDIAEVVLAPFDTPSAVEKAFQTIKPRIYAVIETELWPNTLLAAPRHGAKTVLLNARISNRSFGRYSRLTSLFTPILRQFDCICAISETYKNRLVQMGTNPDNIHVTGNAKFEALLNKPHNDTAHTMSNRLKLPLNAPIFVAGSIRGGEEELVMKAVSALKQTVPNLVVILAPRHMNRLPNLKQAAQQANISHINLTDLIKTEGIKNSPKNQDDGLMPSNSVILVNVMGMLFSIYSVATVAFVGGSLVPKGGQNPMEPAAWACPVLFGPHMENFEEAKEALNKTGGAIIVQNSTELAAVAKKILLTPSYRKEMGQKALNALKSLAQDSATRQAEFILRYLC